MGEGGAIRTILVVLWTLPDGSRWWNFVLCCDWTYVNSLNIDSLEIAYPKNPLVNLNILPIDMACLSISIYVTPGLRHPDSWLDKLPPSAISYI
jgi:hypothetical protein